VKNPRAFFKPLAIGAPDPLHETPVTPSRMIHFLDFSNEKMVAKAPDIARKVDILLGNLEDAVPVERKQAAREGLITVGREMDLGDTALWTRINALESPWVLDDITQIVTEIGHKLSVVMVPKVEGPWDIHYVDRLLAQLEAKAGIDRPILIHALLETSLGVSNLEEIATASPRMQGMSFGPADLAASRRMKTTRVGGGHPGYRTISDPDPDNPDAPRESAQQDLWHYSIGRMVDACTAAGLLPFYGPFGDIKDVDGCEAQFRVLHHGLRRGVVAAPRADRHRQEGLLAQPRRGEVRQARHRGHPRRPRRAHDRRQDAGRRDLEAVPRDGRPRRDARQEGPRARGGLRDGGRAGLTAACRVSGADR
jgi:malyl-CoA/(S)-citramalyl-CoA lyase